MTVSLHTQLFVRLACCRVLRVYALHEGFTVLLRIFCNVLPPWPFRAFRAFRVFSCPIATSLSLTTGISAASIELPVFRHYRKPDFPPDLAGLRGPISKVKGREGEGNEGDVLPNANSWTRRCV